MTSDVGTKMTVSSAYKDLADELIARMHGGDEFATRIVAAMTLLISGWRYGDPDPKDDDDPDDGEAVQDDVVMLLRRAA